MDSRETYVMSVLNHLREEKAKQHLSCDEIAKLTNEMGIAVSDKTIKRVMRPDSTDTNFRLSTLRNIALAMGTDLLNQDANAELARERAMLEKDYDTLLDKNEMLQDEIDARNREIHTLWERIKGFEERLQIKNIRIDDKNAEIRELQKQNKTLRNLAGALVTLLFAYAAAHAHDQIKLRELMHG